MENNPTPSDFEKKVLAHLSLPVALSKEDVWQRLQETLPAAPRQTHFLRWTIAATLVVGLLGSFLRFYTTTIQCPAGEYQTQVLPDGSKVYLHAASTLSYQPYWWSRVVELEGEAFFEVEKGSRFVVQSAQGQTTVLGTSFNVYAREEVYAVVCKTGKVLVTTLSKDSVYLLPEEKAIWTEQRLQKQVPTAQDLAWRQQSFSFEDAPLSVVIAALERHYSININIKASLVKRYQYTGYFQQDKKPEEALQIITISLGLRLKKTANKRYLILQ